MNKRFAFKALCAMVIVSLGLMFFINIFKVSGSTGTEKYRTVVVNKGDTLWNIIKNNCSNYGDIRKAIFDVQKVSNLESANITPGQIIKIPEKYYQ